MEQDRESEKDGEAENYDDGSYREKCDDGDSTSVSSCVSEVQESHEDIQFLRLLDAIHHLLSCRDSLANSLSKGWMEIASARYSMGPSRIDQALFSLKPCPASTLVSVSRTDDFFRDEGHIDEGEQVHNAQQEIQFALQSPNKDGPANTITTGYESAKSDVLPQSHLRRRYPLGSTNMQHADNGFGDGDVGNGGDMAQDACRKAKGSDPLAWFGTLVSPHLRVAQSSFKEALESIVELATAQSTVLMAYRQIQESRGLV